VHRTPKNIAVFCKGGPDRVLDMCSHVNDNGTLKPVTQEVKDKVMAANEVFANLGRRVLAFS